MLAAGLLGWRTGVRYSPLTYVFGGKYPGAQGKSCFIFKSIIKFQLSVRIKNFLSASKTFFRHCFAPLTVYENKPAITAQPKNNDFLFSLFQNISLFRLFLNIIFFPILVIGRIVSL